MRFARHAIVETDPILAQVRLETSSASLAIVAVHAPAVLKTLKLQPMSDGAGVMLTLTVCRTRQC